MTWEKLRASATLFEGLLPRQAVFAEIDLHVWRHPTKLGQPNKHAAKSGHDVENTLIPLPQSNP